MYESNQVLLVTSHLYAPSLVWPEQPKILSLHNEWNLVWLWNDVPRWSLCVENDEEVVLCSHGGSGAQNGAVLCLRDAQFSLKIYVKIYPKRIMAWPLSLDEYGSQIPLWPKQISRKESLPETPHMRRCLGVAWYESTGENWSGWQPALLYLMLPS